MKVKVNWKKISVARLNVIVVVVVVLVVPWRLSLSVAPPSKIEVTFERMKKPGTGLQWIKGRSVNQQPPRNKPSIPNWMFHMRNHFFHGTWNRPIKSGSRKESRKNDFVRPVLTPTVESPPPTLEKKVGGGPFSFFLSIYLSFSFARQRFKFSNNLCSLIKSNVR